MSQVGGGAVSSRGLGRWGLWHKRGGGGTADYTNLYIATQTALATEESGKQRRKTAGFTRRRVTGPSKICARERSHSEAAGLCPFLCNLFQNLQ